MRDDMDPTERRIVEMLDEHPAYVKRHGHYDWSDVVDAARRLGLKRPEEWADRVLYGTG